MSERLWRVLPASVFVLVSGWWMVGPLLDTRSIGSHAVIYAAAARALLDGGNPWTVGPPAAIFAGPPTMLLVYVPFAYLPGDVTRLVWVVGMAAAAVVALRRLRLPAWWIAFPPLLESVVLGHPEVLVLLALVLGGPLAGLCVLIKPYALLPLIASRRWSALLLAALATGLVFPFLPWHVFVAQLPLIGENLARQSHGDSTFGHPVQMLLASIALALLGWRRAAWLATPLLWPNAQPNYKVSSVPALSPLLATVWALPIPGATLAGILIESALVAVQRRRGLPPVLAAAVARGPGATRVTREA